jgi:hypothetical protein
MSTATQGATRDGNGVRESLDRADRLGEGERAARLHVRIEPGDAFADLTGQGILEPCARRVR